MVIVYVVKHTHMLNITVDPFLFGEYLTVLLKSYNGLYPGLTLSARELMFLHDLCSMKAIFASLQAPLTAYC